jgi:preprotein translocase subunit SecG
MMIVIGLLTVFLVLDCLVLMLLVLVQLPKKEAGMGQAFGGAATDALFGAGSGNALTKMTKYATGIFFVLTLTISIMFNMHTRHRSSGFERQLQRSQQNPDLPPATAPAASTQPAAPAGTPNATVAGTPAQNGNGAAPVTPKATTPAPTAPPAAAPTK